MTMATTLGEMLVEARREAGFTTQEVAQRTRIMLAAVQALEEDDYDSLKNVAAGYVRGYLLSYCRLVGVEPQAYLRQYDRQSGNHRQISMGRSPIDQSADRHRQHEHEMNWRVVAVIAAAIVLVAVVIYVIGGLPNRSGLNRILPAPTETTTTVESGALSNIEGPLTPFSFSVKAKEDKATEVKIVVDDAVAYEGSLTSGEEKSYEGVLEAQITISRRKNAVVTQNDTNIPIPADGELMLTMPDTQE